MKSMQIYDSFGNEDDQIFWFGPTLKSVSSASQAFKTWPRFQTFPNSNIGPGILANWYLILSSYNRHIVIIFQEPKCDSNVNLLFLNFLSTCIVSLNKNYIPSKLISSLLCLLIIFLFFALDADCTFSWYYLFPQYFSIISPHFPYSYNTIYQQCKQLNNKTQ